MGGGVQGVLDRRFTVSRFFQGSDFAAGIIQLLTIFPEEVSKCFWNTSSFSSASFFPM